MDQVSKPISSKVEGQSRRMSFIENAVSVVAGYVLTVLIQVWVYPVFGISIPSSSALIISLIIVVAAFVKNFSVRRLFNFLEVTR